MATKLKIFFLVFFIPTYGFAGHIHGGDLNYSFYGIGDITNYYKYKITYNVYMDCDTPHEDFNFVSVVQEDSFISQVNLPLDSLIIIENPEYGCTNLPDNVCVKKTSYSSTVEIPLSNESYFFVIQSCCRLVSLSNILNPSETGATHYIELTPLAQQIQNSSPYLITSPPSILCVNEELNISFKENDVDGHYLVYKLCNPLNETSVSDLFSGTFLPFPLIDFIQPEFSYSNPLGQNAQFFLDSNTGEITLMPETIGQFTVGICIEEYYNGQLLSTVTRDFQFTVGVCEPYVAANLSQNEVDTLSNVVINICNNNQSTIQNQSTDTNYINHFFWTFDNQLDTIYDWNPTLNFSEGGTYTGQLILNPNETCTDTANIIINVNTLLQANFEIDYDTCVGGEVSFTNQSISQGGDITNWLWNFGDSITSELEHTQHLFQNPGNQNTFLIITNEFSCKDTVIKNFDWTPAPPIIVVAPNTFAGCSPLSVFFENLSSPIDSTYEIVWDFGNGNSSSEISPSYIYEEEGIFDITVGITSPIGCQIDTTFLSWIKVSPAPQADFDWQEETVSNLMPDVHFNDLSSEAMAWRWEMNKQLFSVDQHPVFTFQDTGYQLVTLTVFDQYNCKDSLTQIIDVVPEATYFLPNAFSPNGDGVNDIFLGKGLLQNIDFFEMTIYNRWGELIFQTNNPKTGWNGNKIKSGKLAPQGVYTCFVKYQPARKTLKQIKQSFVLIK